MLLPGISVLVWFTGDPGEPTFLKAGPGNQVSSLWMTTGHRSVGTDWKWGRGCPLLRPPVSGSFSCHAAKIFVKGRGVGSFTSQGCKDPPADQPCTAGTAQWQHFCCPCFLLMSLGSVCTGTALAVQPGHSWVHGSGHGERAQRVCGP